MPGHSRGSSHPRTLLMQATIWASPRLVWVLWAKGLWSFCVVRVVLTQVLTHPAYMEDHLAVLDEDIAAGAVPVPTLPKHKQVSSMCNNSMQALYNLLHIHRC